MSETDPTSDRGDESTRPADPETFTPKGNRTRSRLLSAARRLFASEGYANVRVGDLTDAAGLSSGAFYRYFKDKDEVLEVLLRDLLDGFVQFARGTGSADEPLGAVRTATQRYLDFYRENRELYALLIEVSQHDAGVRQMWVESQQLLYDRIRRTLERARDVGLLRDQVDVQLCSVLLNGMTEQYAYHAFVLGQDLSVDTEQVADQITGIWAAGVFGSGPSEATR